MLKVLVAVGLSLFLLTGCGGGDDDDSAEPRGNDDDDATDDGGNSDFHACSLFTAEEIGAAVEAEVGEGRDYLATGPGATQCTWESADGSAAVFIEVLLDGGQAWYDAVHLPGDPEDLEEVEGLGDVAVWDTFLDTLDAVDGDAFVAVQVLLFFSELDDKAVAIELAEMTLERLP